MEKNDNSDGFFMEKKKKTDLSKISLIEFDKRVTRIELVRKEGTKIHVMGKDIKFHWFSNPSNQFYHGIYDTQKKKLIHEDFFQEETGEGLAISKVLSYVGVGLPFLAYQKLGKPGKRLNKTKEWHTKGAEWLNKSEKEWEDKTKHIRIYKASKDSVSRDLGIKLEYIDMGTPNTFIKVDKDYRGDVSDVIKFRAYNFGADAVVEYGNNEGTPVKFGKKIKP